VLSTFLKNGENLIYIVLHQSVQTSTCICKIWK